MNYTLNQLHIFLKIVQTKSITKASEELNLTQPAVSIQLKNFQDQFDVALTETIGRRIHITEFGLEIAKAAEEIMNQIRAINYKTMAFKGQLTGKLKISIVSTGKYVMPYFLNDFMKKYPGIELFIDVTNKQKVIESLENNEVDFALVSLLPKGLKIQTIDLLQNKLYLIGSAKTKEKISVKNIFNEHPLIFREKGSGTRQTMEQFIQKKGISIVKKMELTSNEAVKQAVVAGLGYSIMPLIGIKNELFSKELKIISLKGLPIKTTWSLIWLKDKKHTPVANSYLDFVNENRVQIIQQNFKWYEQYD